MNSRFFTFHCIFFEYVTFCVCNFSEHQFFLHLDPLTLASLCFGIEFLLINSGILLLKT
jgi:hypothetical protein